MALYLASCANIVTNVQLYFLDPFLFFFNDTATTEIYTLSLHDALPIFPGALLAKLREDGQFLPTGDVRIELVGRKDRKSTRLNSSHLGISYAVFCLKKKNV